MKNNLQTSSQKAPYFSEGQRPQCVSEHFGARAEPSDANGWGCQLLSENLLTSVGRVSICVILIALAIWLPVQVYAQSSDIQQFISFSRANGNTFRVLEEKIYAICYRCPEGLKLSPPVVASPVIRLEKTKGGDEIKPKQ